MFKNHVCDTLGENPCGKTPLETPLETSSDAPEGVSRASQPDPISEQESETVHAIVGVPAVLKVWGHNNLLIGAYKIETFAKGNGSHFFRVPARIILNPGVRVEIEVDVE